MFSCIVGRLLILNSIFILFSFYYFLFLGCFDPNTLLENHHLLLQKITRSQFRKMRCGSMGLNGDT